VQNPSGIVGLAVALVIAGTIFFIPIGEVKEVQTYYTIEPLTYEKSVIREVQVPKWIFWDATEVQYIIKNTDGIDGVFTLNFVFTNGKETKSSTQKITILAGAQEAITEVSSFNGVSSVTLNVIPSNKSIPHEITVTKEVTGWDRIWELRSIFSINVGK